MPYFKAITIHVCMCVCVYGRTVNIYEVLIDLNKIPKS